MNQMSARRRRSMRSLDADEVHFIHNFTFTS
jgi:hypothetical protein